MLYSRLSNFCKSFAISISPASVPQHPFSAECSKQVYTDADIKVVNDFLTQVQQQENEEGAVSSLTLIHDLGTKFWGPTKELRELDNTDGEESNVAAVLNTPFPDYSPVAIATTLQHLKKTTHSAIQTDWFLVLDGRAMEDETAVIVNVEGGEDAEGIMVRQVRVEWKTANRYMAAASIAHPGIDESREIAEGNKNGVLRD